MSFSKKPELAKEILLQTLKDLNLEQSLQKYSIWNHWEELVGQALAQKIKPLRIQKDTLIIGVATPSWMTELLFMKTLLLEKIQSKIPDPLIQKLRFEWAPQLF